MTLTRLTPSVYVLQAPTNIGLITSPNGDAIVIDSGIDDSIAKRLLREAEKLGLSIKSIINTHSHADHIGGNSYLTARTGALVYTSALERPYVENPWFEPYTLVGGAYPWKELQNKFLLAKPSSVAATLSAGRISILGIPLEVINLFGHSIGQIGILHDGVLFTGDAFISGQLLEKHGIPYNVDITEYLKTLDILNDMNCSWFVPSHGEPRRDIKADLELNRSTVLSLIRYIEEQLEQPEELESLIAYLCSKLNISALNPGLYFLYRTSVTAYLSYLFEQGRVTTKIEANKLYWYKCK